MKILFFCPRWGSEIHSWKAFLEMAKAAGYDGIEYAIAAETTVAELDEVWNEASRQDMLIIAQHYDTEEAHFRRHYDKYAFWLEKMYAYPVVKINSQTGKDYFSKSQNKALIGLATAYTEHTGFPVVHETHRGKFSFAAHVVAQYLRDLPDLRIALDASHWVCVSESYLENQGAALDLAISRTDHIHARVGYPEGPQVPDPFLPEWEVALDAHLNWWDQVVALKRGLENQMLTISPECGPYPYMVETPLLRKPLASQWDVNVRMMKLLKERYN